MKDRNKTKQQLVDELSELRRQVAELTTNKPLPESAAGPWAEEAERQAQDQLDRRVQRRTAELAAANAALQVEIAERKQMEVALHVSEQRLRFAMEGANDGIWDVQLETGEVYMSPRGCEILGYLPSEMGEVARVWSDLVHPDDLQLTRERLTAHLEEHTPIFEVEQRLRTKSGDWKWVLARGKLVERDALGKPLRMTGTHTDITERKLAEAALRESEERFRALAETTSAVIVLYDAERLLYANPAAQRLTGYTQEELLQRSFLEVVHPDSRAEMQQRAQRRLQGEPVDDEAEIKIVTRNSEERWITLRGGQTTYQNRLVGMGTAFDITDRKQAEARLAHSHDLMRYIIEHNRSAVAVHDRDLKYVYVSQRYLDEYKIKDQDVIGKHHYEVFPDLPQKWRDVHQRALAGRASSAEDDPYVREDGSVDWTRWECRPWYEADGSIGGIIIYTEVITERKRAEEALRLSEAQLSNALRMANAGHWEYDVASDVFTFNDNFYRIFRVTAEEAGGYKMPSAEYARRFCHLDDMLMVHTEIQAAIETTDPDFSRQLEHRVLYNDGKIGYIAVRFFIVKDSQGRTVKTYGVNQDITERKRAEEALRESEMIFSSFLEHSPIYVFFKDKDVRALRLSKNYEHMLGMPLDRALGKTMDDLFPSDLAKSMMADDLRILNEGRRVDVVEELGGRVYETTKFPIIKDGQPFMLAGFTVDITERQRADQALRESEERYRRLIETSPDAITLTDLGGTIIFCNQQAALLQGLGHAEEMIGRSAFEFVAPESAPLAIENARKILETGSIRNVEYTSVKSDGTRFLVELSASAILDVDGQPNALIGVVRDITDRKRAEEALRESQQLISVALQTAKAGAWKWDRKTNKASWSDENYLVMGLAPGSVEAAYANWLACIHPDDRQAAELRVAEAMEQRSELNATFRVIWPDGSVHWINDIGQTIYDEAGESIGMYGIQMDITERIRSEHQREALLAELEARNTELERFTYTVSHDLKSPLITIRGFLGFLQEDALTGNFDRLQADLARIRDATDKMHRLLDELLELSRVGRKMNAPQHVPFGDIVREALELVSGQIKTRGVTVAVADGLPVVYGDRARLVEVVQNLVDNAVKFSGDNREPRVEIGARAADHDEGPVFYVRDNGIGVDPQYHERIFGLFNKLDVQSDGTGVGLALVRRIVEVHGGRVWVESEGAGRGSTFCFTVGKPHDDLHL